MTMLRSSTLAAGWTAFLVVTCLAAPTTARAQATYKVTELLIGPKTDTSLYSAGRGINKSGLSTIEYGYSFAGYAAAWCAKAVCTRIPAIGEATLAFSATTPGGINDLGQVTGASFTGHTTHAFLFDGVSTTDLGGLPEDGCGGCMLDSIGRDINNLGAVVGVAYTLSGAARAFVYRDATMESLGTLGGDFSEARAVNDKGDVVGMSTVPGEAPRAFLHRNGLMQDLGTLGGSQSAAFAGNEMRQVVGCSTTAGDVAQLPFIHQQGAMAALATLGGNDSCAYAINRYGSVVGYSTAAGSTDPRATLWQGGELIDLNGRLDAKSGRRWVMTEARAINDKGQIVATGVHRGVTRAALLTPMAAR
jgi:probable HAF family extracellular repeat protein